MTAMCSPLPHARNRLSSSSHDPTALAHRRRPHLPLPALRQGQIALRLPALRPRCEECGLDYSFADSGDGPAVFIILVAGFLVVFAALIIEFLYQPPFWVHAVLWLPLILAATIFPLRPMKGLMIALQFHHKAAEGKLEKLGDRK